MSLRPSLSLTLWILFIAGVIGWTYRPIRAIDTWMHLASGQYIDKQRAAPRTDPFSFTCPDAQWIDHEWLYQWGLYRLYKTVGFAGIQWTKVILILLTLVAVACTIRLYGYSSVFCMTGTLLFYMIHRQGWSERADLISLVGLAWLIYELESHRLRTPDSSSNRLWLWPLGFTLWANLHGGFILGLVLMGCYAIKAKWLWKWIILCVLATLVNPYGIQLPLSIAHGLLEIKPLDISEWQRTPWSPMQAFWITLAVCWFSALMSRMIFQSDTTEADNGRLLALAALSIGAIQHVRNIRYFLLLAVPVLFSNLLPVYQRASPVFIRIYTYAILCFLTVWAFSGLFSMRGGIDHRIFPEAACRYIEQNQIPGPFYNDYGFGSYWIWRMSPNYPVFIDGRLHMVDGYIDLYEDIQSAKTGAPDLWHAFMDRFGIRSVFLAAVPASMVPTLRLYFPETEWDLVFTDSTSLVLTRHLS